jgi:DNA repair protein RadA/Sms
MAVLSSNADLAIPKTIAFSAEIGLSGEIRAVNRLEQRLSEVAKLGYEKVIISSFSKGIDLKKNNIEVVCCAKIEEVVKNVFS